MRVRGQEVKLIADIEWRAQYNSVCNLTESSALAQVIVHNEIPNICALCDTCVFKSTH